MKKKKLILGGIVFVGLVIALLLVWFNFREKPVVGSKHVTIEVVNEEEKSTIYELQTDAKYLEEAMIEAKEQGLTYEGDEGAYGLMITHINGKRAVYEKDHAYWSFYVNGEYCQYGIKEQPVEDGDAFKIVYEKSNE